MSRPASAAGQRQFDLIIWGATGFTGKLAAEYVARNYGPSGSKLKYALAGRNLQKLEQVRESLEKIVPGCKDVPLLDATLSASGSGTSSLQDLAAKTTTLLTFVGPYVQHGEPVVAACVAAGTNYVDITGEVTWVRQMIQKYHEQARTKNIKIVHCCGFDCIPFDIGTFVIQKTAIASSGRPCTEVKCVVLAAEGGVSGGTIHSAMGIMEVPWKDLLATGRTDLIEEGNELPASSASRPLVHQRSNPMSKLGWDKVLKCWCSPFIMTPVNAKIIRRSASFNPSIYGHEFSYFEAVRMPNLFFHVLNMFFLVSGSLALMFFSPLRWLLKKLFPQGQGPSRARMDSGYFEMRFIGTGLDKDNKPMQHQVRFGSREGDPGYKETAKMAVEAALSSVFTTAQTPKLYGVLTPASAYGQTLVDRLKEHKIEIEVLDKDAGRDAGKKL